MASVTRTDRSGAVAITNAASSGATCTPSTMSSTNTRSSAHNASTGPGARWCIGGIALNRWVAPVAPAAMAARVVPWSAPVWPTAATTPRAASRAIDSSAPGSSGAMVTMRMVPRPRSTSAATSAGAGMTRRAGSWAPRYSGASHGPSRWMPAIVPRSTSRVRTSTCRSRAAVDPVTRLATTVVVPWARCVAAARATSAGSSVTKDAPPPPWQCTSTNPGARTGSERSGCAGGTPSPTSTIVPPSMRTQPLRKLVPSKSRSAAISVVGAMTATYRGLPGGGHPVRPGSCRFRA